MRRSLRLSILLVALLLLLVPTSPVRAAPVGVGLRAGSFDQQVQQLLRVILFVGSVLFGARFVGTVAQIALTYHTGDRIGLSRSFQEIVGVVFVYALFITLPAFMSEVGAVYQAAVSHGDSSVALTSMVSWLANFVIAATITALVVIGVARAILSAAGASIAYHLGLTQGLSAAIVGFVLSLLMTMIVWLSAGLAQDIVQHFLRYP